MGKIKEILMNWRVLLLLVFVLLSIWTIQPKLESDGVVVSGIVRNSSAEVAGMVDGETILYFNNQKIDTINDYNEVLNSLSAGDIAKISTEENVYSVLVEGNESIYLGLNVKPVPTSNLQKGLDLVGGARVILEPEGEITDQQMTDAVEIISKRLNIYGISDIVIKPSEDLEGNKYIIIELAGATRDEVQRLVGQQGKFEAKIGNETVFVGGKDIKYLDNQRAGLVPSSCGQVQDGAWSCRFSFSVDVSVESAEKHAAITKDMPIIYEGNEPYLEQKLDMYLDDELVSSLLISESLKGVVSTNFAISGSGQGNTETDAKNNALDEMINLRTVLKTGSLPIKLNIAKIDIVSPSLGNTFFMSALMALGVAILAVGATIFIRYRKIAVTIPIIISGVSEVIIILGFAALIRWNLDLAAIAGILAAIGTGVDGKKRLDGHFSLLWPHTLQQLLQWLHLC